MLSTCSPKIGGHLGNMLLFVIDKRFIMHLRNDDFALFDVVEGRVQGHKAISRLLFQPAHLLQTRKLFSERSVAEVTTICGTLRHSSLSS